MSEGNADPEAKEDANALEELTVLAASVELEIVVADAIGGAVTVVTELLPLSEELFEPDPPQA
ncbi:MAG: hypothetical protein WC007_00140 [Pelobacteraceae bacterium]